jgi:hypothetical protein
MSVIPVVLCFSMALLHLWLQTGKTYTLETLIPALLHTFGMPNEEIDPSLPLDPPTSPAAGTLT